MAQDKPTTTKDETATECEAASGSEALTRGAKIAGEALVIPGTSLILDGKIVAGGAHIVAGVLAKMALGPLGCLLVAANSYTKSVSGQHLHEHFMAAKG